MTDRTLLSDDELAARLVGLPGWSRVGDELVRELVFADFVEAFGFLSMVAMISEKLDHHAEITNTYNRVRLAVTTHDRDGLTEVDLAFAERVDAALGES